MEKVTVAVIGGGPSGLSMLKTLREDGYAVTLFERRTEVGGLWAYTDDTRVTTALPVTTANVSKFTSSFSDFPIPNEYPPYLTAALFTKYFQLYAQHFDLTKNIIFNAIVKNVVRTPDDAKWQLEAEISGKAEIQKFDKVAFCHGYQSKPNIPEFEGQESFEGSISHAQQYRGPKNYKDKKVVIVGMANTAADIAADLQPHASELYMSHRRGAIVASRWRNGLPVDLTITWQRRQMSKFMGEHFPKLTTKLADTVLAYMMRKQWGGLDPSWRLQPSPSITTTLPAVSETLIPFLREGKVKSRPGIRRFRGPRSIEFLDGTLLDDVDAVICATGCTADFSLAPFVSLSSPPNGNGREIRRLYRNLFPPRYADSIVFLNYSAFGKNNGIGFTDLISMAISNIWRGNYPLPPIEAMEADIDAHHIWVAKQWDFDSYMDESKVKQGQWQAFLHDAAGTGMDNLGWGWKGWKFWWTDREMSNLIRHGVDTSFAFRYFETGKRRTWSGARRAIIDINESVKALKVEK